MDKRTIKNGLKNEWDLTGKLNRVTTQKGNYVFITDYEYYRLVPGSDIYGKIIKFPYIKLIRPENLKSEMKKHEISIAYLPQNHWRYVSAGLDSERKMTAIVEWQPRLG